MNIQPADNSFEKTGCQLEVLLKFLAQEWMGHIIWALAKNDSIRFGALRRALPGAISARVLSSRLKTLEAHGLVTRTDIGTLPLHVEYALTPEGRNLDVALRRNELLSSRLKELKV